jgi:hypothetical protein
MRTRTKQWIQETLGGRRFWSDLEVSELRKALKSAQPLNQIAAALSRDLDEVIAKIAELSGMGYRIKAISGEQPSETQDEIADANSKLERSGKRKQVKLRLSMPSIRRGS